MGIRKWEGDGVTPAGSFALRRLFYRPDRLARPRSGLSTRALTGSSSWCEDPASPLYNHYLEVDAASGMDRMWRDDHLYDVVVEIGYNDAPAIKSKESAIFLHLARPDYGPTAGCIALSHRHMLQLLPSLWPQTVISIG